MGSADRRRFLEVSIFITGAGTVLALGLPGASFLLTPLRREQERTWVDLGEASALRAAGVPLAVRFSFEAWRGYVHGKRPGLLWVVPDEAAQGGVLVLSAVCTHKACNVSWSHEEDLFACPCHKGRFDAAGEVVSGPPRAPLQRVPIRLDEGRLWAEITESLA